MKVRLDYSDKATNAVRSLQERSGYDHAELVRLGLGIVDLAFDEEGKRISIFQKGPDGEFREIMFPEPRVPGRSAAPLAGTPAPQPV